MRIRLFAAIFSLAMALPAFAAEKYIVDITANTTTNWNVTGSWNPSGLPGSGDNVGLTNILSGAGVLTVTGAVGGTTINFINIGGTTASSADQTNWVIFGRRGINSDTYTSSFGGNINARGVLEITNNLLVFGINNSLTYNNLGNIFVRNNGTFALSTTQLGTRKNDGTITLDSTTGTATFDYANTTGFTNAGTIISMVAGSGQNQIVGSNSTVGSAFFANTGTINIQSGLLIMRIGDAFTENGFNNSGTILINGGTLSVDRTANAWINNNSGVWSNRGTVILNGGTYTLRQGGSATTTRTNSNFGTFQGGGNIRFRVNNDNGTILASNGVLNLEEALVGNGGTLRAGTGAGGGTLVLQTTLAALTLSGNIFATNDGAIVFSGNNNWTLNSFARIGGIAANDRGTLISSNTLTVFLNNAAYAENNGTLMIVGGGGINFGQVGDMTNKFVMTGVGSFTGAFGTANRSVVNQGTIAAVQGGVLTIDSRNANNNGGFSNTSAGTVVITDGSTLALVRSNGAWNGSAPVKNSGTILINNGTLETWGREGSVQTLAPDRFMRNDATIIAQGQGTSTNRINVSIDNAGTIFVTNNTAVLNIEGTSALTNTSSGKIFIGGSGAVGTLQATNIGVFINAGRIEGQGTLQLGRPGADAAGANANLQNTGFIVATNYGSASQGTLTINPGNAFSNGGLRNDTGGTILVGSNMNVVLNRLNTAWVGGGGVVSNLGTVFMQGGTFTTSTDGGAAVTTANRTNFNVGLITGWGTYLMLVTNGANGQVLADARGINNRDQGTLTVSLLSFTNNVGSTIGAIGTNSTLKLVLPTGNALVNYGTVQFSAGNVVIQGGGVISNYFAIAGVGDLSTLPIVQAGSAPSLIAKDPTDGFTALIASVDPTNTLGALLGASTNAELRLTVSGGGNSLVNRGSMTIDGGSITVGGGSGTISNDVGGIFYGQGTNENLIVTSHITSKILASNGLLQVGLANNLNTGSLESFGVTDRLVLTNSVLLNQGTLKANGGSITLRNGGVVTNSGTILSAGTYNSSLVNVSGGQIIANGGIMNLGTLGATVSNAAGGIIRTTAGTLNVLAAAWNNAGNITNASGAVITNATGSTGLMTNSGLVVNQGTIGLQVVNSGTITNSGGHISYSVTNTSGGLIMGSGTLASRVMNFAGGTIVATNGILNLGVVAGQVVSNAGVIRVVNGGTLNVLNDWNNTGSITNFGGLVTGNAVTNSGVMVAGANATNSSANLVLRSTGTLVITNGSFGVTTTGGNELQNSGAIQVVALIGNNGTLDYAGTAKLVNLAGATINKTGDGEFNLKGTDNTVGGNNKSFYNAGSVIVNDGTLRVDVGNTFTDGGFLNAVGGLLQINTNANVKVSRFSGVGEAWLLGPAPTNFGTIFMNGGTLLTADGGSANSARIMVNASGGLIRGNGTLNYTVRNENGGVVEARSGTLTVVNANNNNGTWVSTNFGGTESVLNFTTGGFDLGAGTTLNSNGTLRLTGGANVTLSTSYRENSGTLNFDGVGSLFLANSPFAGALTNGALGTIKQVSASTGTLQTGFGAGNQNFFVVNRGTIAANSGTLIIDPNDANTIGFSNASTGQIIISNAANLIVMRTVGAWTGGDNIKNAGNIFLNGGTFATFDQGGVAPNTARILQNDATISGFGTISASVTNFGTLMATNGTLNLVIAPGNAGALIVGNNGTLNVVPSWINSGQLLVQGGTVIGGTLTNSSSGTIINSGTITSILINQGVVQTIGGTLALTAFRTNAATLLAGNGGTIQVGTAGLTEFSNASSLILSNGTVFSGNVTNLAGATISGFGTMTGRALILASSTLEATNGTLYLLLAPTLAGTVNLQASGTVSVGSGGSVLATNLGVINFLGGSFASGGLTNLAGGKINAVSGTGTVTGGLAINAASAFINATNGALVFAGNLENSGSITNAAILKLGATGNGLLTNVAGTIVGAGVLGGTGTLDGNVVNLAAGVVDTTNGTLVITKAPTNLGTVRVQGGANSGTLQIGTTGATAWDNGGLLDMRGGTVDSGNLTNSARIVGQGSITGKLVNNADVYVTNGVLTLSSAPVNNGNIHVLGGSAVGNRGTLSVTPAWVNNGSVILSNNGYVAGTELDNANLVRVTGLGTITSVLENRNGGVVDVLGSLTYVHAAGSVVSNLVGGTYNLSGQALRIFATDGSSNDLRNAGTLNLNSGTFAAGSVINAGTLNVQHSSTGTLTLKTGGSLSNAGRIVVNSGTFLVANGALVNSGVIDTYGTGVIGGSGLSSPSIAGLFTNLAGGVILNTNGTATLGLRANSGNFVNLGNIVVSNGATINLINGSSTGQSVTNYASGNILVGNGSSDGILNSGTLVNQGNINGSGTLNLGLGTAGRQLLNDASGTLRVLDGRTLSVSNIAGTVSGLGGQVYNSGAIIVGTGASELRLISSIAGGLGITNINAGDILLNGGTLSYISTTVGVLTNDIAGYVHGSGFITNAYVVNTGIIRGTSASAALDFADSVVRNLAGGEFGATAGRTIVNTVFTNLGSVAYLNGVGTFNSDVLNGGDWMLDPSTNNIAGNLTIAGARTLDKSVDIIGGSLTVQSGSLYTITNSSETSVSAIYSNAGTTTLRSSIATFSGTAVNVDTYQTTNSTTTFGSGLRNAASGTLAFANQSRVTVGGIFTNLGAVTFLNSVGTFNSSVVNAGNWITDPTTNVFHNTFTVTPSGQIIADAGDVYVFSTNNTGGSGVASFVNQSKSNVTWSTQNAALNTSTSGAANLGTKFQFEGDGVLTQDFFHAGLTLTGGFIGVPSTVTETQIVSSFSAVAGFRTNFALGTLELTNTFVRLSDTFGTVSPDDGKLGGLFVKNLFISADSMLIISNNMRVYFINSNNWDSANIFLAAGAELHQLTFAEGISAVPEPTVVLLWMSGFATVYAARRRNKKNRSKSA